ncbi:hypothetical protein [Meiothermus taiwanensis]|jgi:hypothetical protein|uniref:Sporulation protein cse60 n=2 Tax=Meiothermus taiwanensis TaxID=172827 RepID=A0A399DV64_9DEIN|nr:hypothetical protein [Meiothermus taiwanensis]AWR87945.1 hypothetical protein Mtai_v1c27170 [Meiothermus taiwanensis WR-220]KIQ54342.1 hypothetical protein SY28_09095 [Meiothermus taiwanensis]KZK17017.1 hypothetical protein A3962_03855 [Meiothermus taiwanensis]RIH75058.1 hypothetical protein Mcate_02414 [Meiothermus taiwanensis]
MQGVQFKLISATDPDIFQERLNRFVESLPLEALLIDVKFSTSQSGSQTTYAALVQYKSVEEWKE